MFYFYIVREGLCNAGVLWADAELTVTGSLKSVFLVPHHCSAGTLFHRLNVLSAHCML